MLFTGTVSVPYDNHKEHINTLCGQNTEFMYLKGGGTYVNHWILKR
jgi:hypothetical protein